MALEVEAAGRPQQEVDKEVCRLDTREEEDTDKVGRPLARHHRAVEV